MTRATKSRQQFETEALVAAGLRASPGPVEAAPNQRSFTLDEDGVHPERSRRACLLLRRDAPSLLPNFPRMRYPPVVPGPDGMTGPERLAVTGKREPGE